MHELNKKAAKMDENSKLSETQSTVVEAAQTPDYQNTESPLITNCKRIIEESKWAQKELPFVNKQLHLFIKEMVKQNNKEQ